MRSLQVAMVPWMKAAEAQHRDSKCGNSGTDPRDKRRTEEPTPPTKGNTVAFEDSSTGPSLTTARTTRRSGDSSRSLTRRPRSDQGELGDGIAWDPQPRTPK